VMGDFNLAEAAWKWAGLPRQSGSFGSFLPGPASLIHKNNYLDVTWIDHVKLTVWLLVKRQACAGK